MYFSYVCLLIILVKLHHVISGLVIVSLTTNKILSCVISDSYYVSVTYHLLITYLCIS